MSASLFVFRRDLRLEDNTGLIEAAKSSDEVIPCFILDPRQIKNNEYRSVNSLQFMFESLKDLEKQLTSRGGRLFLFKGLPHKIISDLINDEEITSVFVNRDYTPFSRRRDEEIRKVCEKKGVFFKSFGDYLINEPETILKKDGKPYTVFTHFYNKSVEQTVRLPQKNRFGNYFRGDIPQSIGDEIYGEILPKENKEIAVRGGRTNALKILSNISKFRDYGKTRDYFSEPTTMLSAHLKYGTVSIRETYYSVYKALGSQHPLLRQLYWRDFFTYIAHHFPKIFGKAFHEKYDGVKWSYDREAFSRWCEGRTGFPIVDAGMRQLNETGFMHNRARMICASFLVKDLHIDWRMGEKYFAQKLVDYDPSVNNGNWQWSASTGCDSQPYFRILNPWLQQKKFDLECVYIKKWVSELRDAPVKEIHNLWKTKKQIGDYPKPIVDHRIESNISKAAFKAIT